jgi:hypothetical protein
MIRWVLFFIVNRPALGLIWPLEGDLNLLGSARSLMFRYCFLVYKECSVDLVTIGWGLGLPLCMFSFLTDANSVLLVWFISLLGDISTDPVLLIWSIFSSRVSSSTYFNPLACNILIFCTLHYSFYWYLLRYYCCL